MIGSLIAAGGSLLGGLFGSNSAEKAAELQYKAAMKSLALQREMWQTTRNDSMPWMNAGNTALDRYMSELGLSNGKGFQETPGYQFAFNEGMRGVTNNLAALGMKNSGAAMKAINDYGQNMANQEYGNWLNRIAGLQQQGQGAAQGLAAANNNLAQGGSNALIAGGQAQASGVVGAANNWQNAFNGVGNALGQYMQGRSSYGGAINYGTAGLY